MKARSLLALVMTGLLVSATLYAAEEVKLEGIKCLMNPKAAAKAETGVDYKGGKVYFCCGNCAKKFSDDQEKNAVAANAQLVATKQAKQEKCPISGEPCDAEKSVKVAGVAVYFCCENCQGKVAKASDKEQLELCFSNKAFDKAFKVGAEEKK